MSRTPSAQERALLRRYHVEGDLEARRELIERMLPFVRRIARRYANKGVPLDDLIQVGCIGLIKAIDRFDLSRGVRLTSFAEPNIAGEIKRHFRDHGWSVHMPRDLQELHARITRETERLSGTLGRGPTAQELADRLECPPERVVEALLAARSYDAGSLDAASDETGEPQVNRLGGPDPEFDRADRMLLLRAGARSLPPRQRRIVHLRYFHDLSQREIAREVGVSQMHVSRLLQQSLHQLRAAIDGDEDRRAA